MEAAIRFLQKETCYEERTQHPLHNTNRAQAGRSVPFESRGVADYGNRFTLDGKQFGNDHTAGLVAMNAVAGLAATDARAREFAEALWDTPVPTGQWRYYDGMLYLLAMLHCSGEFKIWGPP